MRNAKPARPTSRARSTKVGRFSPRSTMMEPIPGARWIARRCSGCWTTFALARYLEDARHWTNETGAGLRRWLAMWQGDAGSRSWNAPGVLRGLSPPARGLRTIALVVAAGARAQRAGGGLGDDAEARSAAAPPRGEHAARARADATATRGRDPRELGPRRGYWAFHGVRPGVVASPSSTQAAWRRVISARTARPWSVSA